MNREEYKQFVNRIDDAHRQVKRDKQRAHLRTVRKLQHTGPNSKQRKADNEAIAEYLARTPPPRYV